MHVLSCGKLAGPTAATGEGLRGIICVAVFTAAVVKLGTGAGSRKAEAPHFLL